MRNYDEYRREMRVRGVRMYWHAKIKRALTIAGYMLAVVTGTAVLWVAMCAYMLVFPD